MPSIEIICVGQTEPLDFSAMPFAVTAEKELQSHRGHSSLFQKDFDSLHGCIYHIGNPRLKDPDAGGAFFASDLLIDWWEQLELRSEYIQSAKLLIVELLAASPEGHLVFTSDYQFGPYPRRRFLRWRTQEEFWQLHDAQKLRMNALYQIHDDRKPE